MFPVGCSLVGFTCMDFKPPAFASKTFEIGYLDLLGAFVQFEFLFAPTWCHKPAVQVVKVIFGFQGGCGGTEARKKSEWSRQPSTWKCNKNDYWGIGSFTTEQLRPFPEVPCPQKPKTNWLSFKPVVLKSVSQTAPRVAIRTRMQIFFLRVRPMSR